MIPRHSFKSGINVKPFLKWAGGKRQLLPEIKKYYPFRKYGITKYAEPFVGSGAVLFDILSQYDIKKVYINDFNIDLINTYIVIRDIPEELLNMLKCIKLEYFSLDEKQRKSFFEEKRNRFNHIKIIDINNHNIERAALLIFLNRTCFNGLYRVNKKGLFNVPFGSYKTPNIYDEENIIAISEILKNVIISCGDYHILSEFIDCDTFIYLDPPYRPLSATSSFVAYTENAFDDEAQIVLSNFVLEMDKKGAKVLVSNSDTNDGFFEQIYSRFKIKRIYANRMINCDGKNRGKITELLISNF